MLSFFALSSSSFLCFPRRRKFCYNLPFHTIVFPLTDPPKEEGKISYLFILLTRLLDVLMFDKQHIFEVYSFMIFWNLCHNQDNEHSIPISSCVFVNHPLSLLTIHRQPLIFFLSVYIGFTLFIILYKWKHTVCTLFLLLFGFFKHIILRFILLLCVSVVYFTLLLCGIVYKSLSFLLDKYLGWTV